MTQSRNFCVQGTVAIVVGLSLHTSPAHAVCPGTIVSGENVTTTQVLTNDESCIVEEGGSISTGAFIARGIQAQDRNTITNDGTIETFGGDADGIQAGDNNTISNSGTVRTSAINAEGITVANRNAITNSGTIRTTGFGAEGIETGDNNWISNTGTIRTSAFEAEGIDAGNDNTIINRGTIRTNGFIARGIFAQDGNEITNRGTIRTSGLDADGIGARDGNTIWNTATIVTSGEDADGIETRDNNTVINSGFIKATGTNANAINFGGGTNNLILKPGSRIVGLISLGTGRDVLTVENGLSIDHTFTADNGVPEVIDTNGAPFVVSDDRQVIVVDPTGFASAQTWLSDVTRSIFNGLDSGVGNFGANDRPVAVLASLDGVMPLSAMADSEADGTGLRVWGMGFGGYRDQQDKGAVVEVDHVYGGGFGAVEVVVSEQLGVGVLAGGATSDLDARFDSGNIDVTTGFGGIYGRYETTVYWLNLMVIGGYADFDSRRRVANNTVDDGVETAKGNYGGAFIAPAATVGTAIDGILPGHSILPSLRVQYAGLFLDGYKEKDVANPLDVSSREVHLVGGRAQFAVPHDMQGSDGALYRLQGRVGLDAEFVVGGDNVDASVAALPMSFSGTYDDSVVTGFIGASLTRVSDDGRFFVKPSIEGFIDTNNSTGVRGFLSAGLQF